MSMRSQKKSIYLVMVAAATCVTVAVFISVFIRGADAQTTETETSTAKAHTPEELSRYIDRMGSSYRSTRMYLSQADVPGLIAMLEDAGQSKNWWGIVALLAYIDKEGESVDALIDFIYRAEDWELLRGPRAWAEMLAKVDAIARLGLIGGDTATDALRLLLTAEGTNQYLGGWSDEAIEGSFVSKDLVRLKAAMGLVYTQEAANIQLVEAFYQSVLPRTRAINQRPGQGTIVSKSETKEEQELSLLYLQAATALALRDYIRDEGMESWKAIMDDGYEADFALIMKMIPSFKALEE